jgi:hypothetical protein
MLLSQWQAFIPARSSHTVLKFWEFPKARQEALPYHFQLPVITLHFNQLIVRQTSFTAKLATAKAALICKYSPAPAPGLFVVQALAPHGFCSLAYYFVETANKPTVQIEWDKCHAKGEPRSLLRMRCVSQSSKELKEA